MQAKRFTLITSITNWSNTSFDEEEQKTFQRKMRRVGLVKNSRIYSQGDPSSSQFASKCSLIRSLSNDDDGYENIIWKVNSGGGAQQIFIRGGSAPRSNPLPFYVPFFTKRYPLRTPSVDKWYPFFIPRLELCIPFHCCKCIVNLNRNQFTKIGCFPDFIKP